MKTKNIWKGKLLYQQVEGHESGPGKGTDCSQKLVCRDVSTGKVDWALPVKLGEYDDYFWVTEGERDRVYTTHPEGRPGERRRDEFRLSCHDFATGAEITEETIRVPGFRIREFALRETGADHWSARTVAFSPGVVWIAFRYFLGSPQRKFLVAIDHATGKPLWKQKVPQLSSVRYFVNARILMTQEQSITCYGPRPPRKAKRS